MEVNTTISLTAKEEKFIAALGQGLAPTRAAKVAGWSVGSASRLIQKPHIRAALLAVHNNTAEILRKLEQGEAVDGDPAQGAALDGDPEQGAAGKHE